MGERREWGENERKGSGEEIYEEVEKERNREAGKKMENIWKNKMFGQRQTEKLGM